MGEDVELVRPGRTLDDVGLIQLERAPVPVDLDDQRVHLDDELVHRLIQVKEVQHLADQIVQLGNSTYGDRFIFGGFQTATPPVSGDGHYAGDDGLIYVQLDEDNFRPINIPGRRIFEISVKDAGPEGKNVALLRIVQDFRKALETNDKEGIFLASSRLDGAVTQMAELTASLGARRAAVQDAAGRLDNLEGFILKDNVSIEASDPVSTALDMKRAETALSYTMNASAKVLGPSLMDFLK